MGGRHLTPVSSGLARHRTSGAGVPGASFFSSLALTPPLFPLQLPPSSHLSPSHLLLSILLPVCRPASEGPLEALRDQRFKGGDSQRTPPVCLAGAPMVLAWRELPLPSHKALGCAVAAPGDGAKEEEVEHSSLAGNTCALSSTRRGTLQHQHPCSSLSTALVPLPLPRLIASVPLSFTPRY